MSDWEITSASPWWCVLLVLAVGLPPFWVIGWPSRLVLGWARWLVVNLIRSTLLTLLVLALFEVQMVRTSDRLTVIYLLDQSLSIPAEQRRAMIDYVNAAILQQRLGADRVGVIVFGREAAMEIPPIDDDVQMLETVESPLNPDFTNLAAALKLAQASFPEDAAKRIVIVSDGNENLGHAQEQAEGLRQAGIGIDVVPIRYPSRRDVVVERLTTPGNVRRDQPFDMKVVVTNTATPPRPGEDQQQTAIPGRLVVSQLAGGQSRVLAERAVVLPPGRKKVFTLGGLRIDSPNFYTYEAKFIPDHPSDDALSQNNRATAFTHVRGRGRVLLIEDFENQGQFDLLADRLRRQGLEVTPQSSNQLFDAPSDLMPYDAVVLADVPREQFSDDQISMLVLNTQQMGAGLVMLGGPNSFGAGGWIGTELEKAMPVDFQIRNAKVVPRGALVLLIHACEIPRGNYWQKKVAEAAIKALGAQDYCGLLYWGTRTDWMWGRGLLPVGPHRNRMLSRVNTMIPGDMPDFDQAFRMAVNGFRRVPDAAVRHMIIISDGDPSFADPSVLTTLTKMKVTVTAVAIGAHGSPDRTKLQGIAAATGGKYYEPKSPNALPRIFQREARQVARPLVYENPEGFLPQVYASHELIKGIEALPPITGYVLTNLKENPLVEVPLVSPLPAGRATDRNRTLLAAWTYGLGKAVAFTSDAGSRWTKLWATAANLPRYDKLFGQLIGWSMRPPGDSGNFTVATEIEDQRVRVVVTALDENDEFLNFLEMRGGAVGPDLKPIDFQLQQTAPGRYVGTFPTAEPGAYFLVVHPGLPQTGPILSGINLPYSDEFRHRQANEVLLKNLAALIPAGEQGQAGMVIEPAADDKLAHPWLSADTFRHQGLPPARSSQDVWHLLVLLGSGVFFVDVFARRVQVGFVWLVPLTVRVRDWILRRQPAALPDKTIERLRTRKAEVADSIEKLRSDTRFEPSQPAAAETVEEMELPGAAPGPPLTSPPPLAGQEAPPEGESHTERLLRAKKRLWKKPDDK